MKSFNDSTGRAWSVQVNVAAIKRVRDLAGVDLLAVLEGDLLQRLSEDPVLLVDVIYALLRPQANAAGVSDVQFGEAMAGEAIDQATAALLEELVSFFPLARRRILQAAVAKMRSLQEALVDTAMTRIQKVQLPPWPGEGSGSALASSASTPANGPSAS